VADKESGLSEGVEDTAAIVAGAVAGTALVAAAAPAAVVAAAVAGVPIALRRGIAAWQQRRIKRLARWWDAFLHDVDLSSEQVLERRSVRKPDHFDRLGVGDRQWWRECDRLPPCAREARGGIDERPELESPEGIEPA
jgi:hypothetical protein